MATLKTRIATPITKRKNPYEELREEVSKMSAAERYAYLRSKLYEYDRFDAPDDLLLEIHPTSIINGVSRNPASCAGAYESLTFHGTPALFFKSVIYFLRPGPDPDHPADPGFHWLRYNASSRMRRAEAINDVVMKDLEACEKYAEPMVLKAPTGQRRLGVSRPAGNVSDRKKSTKLARSEADRPDAPRL